MRIAILRVSVMVAVVAAAASPSAAEPTDARWRAWLGCWQQLEESVRAENLLEPGGAAAVPTPGVAICVTPTANPDAVTFSTIVETQSALEEVVVADGSSRPIQDAACSGSQRTRWSDDGRRIFSRAELSCADGSTREVSGIAAMAPGPVWVDIQVVDADGRESIRVRRYRRSPDQAQVAEKLTGEQLAAAATATLRQAAPFTLAEVQEAVTKASPTALEAALIETRSSFPLNAERLLELDAHVPDRVLDLMIALSFPKRFVVERRTLPPAPGAGLGLSPLGWWELTYLGYYGYYDLFPYHYAPFGYRNWGYYDPYFVGGPGYGIATATTELRPSGEGRVVDGLGYTRVRARVPQPVNLAGMPMGEGSSGGPSGSSGGTVSTQGYSSGGGDSGGGRTAVSRPPD